MQEYLFEIYQEEKPAIRKQGKAKNAVVKPGAGNFNAPALLFDLTTEAINLAVGFDQKLSAANNLADGRTTSANSPVGFVTKGEPDNSQALSLFSIGEGREIDGLAFDEAGAGSQSLQSVDSTGDGAGERERDCDFGDAGIAELEANRNLNNYLIEQSALGSGGAKEKFWRNLEIIELMQRLHRDAREATREEKDLLVQYVGFGMFPQAFGSDPDWKNERNALKNLLSEAEYEAARASTINAHYTSLPVIRAIWRMVERLGFTGGRVLEPGCGIGHFFGCAPVAIAHRSRFTGVELDPTTARIAELLYPDANLHNRAFQDVPYLTGFYDLAIGNVPFGDIVIRADKRFRSLRPSLHNYFILRSLAELRDGGILAFITSRYTMDSQDSTIREAIQSQADLLAAIRLPHTAFKRNAGTDVVTDILIFRKRGASDEPAPTAWTGLKATQDPDGHGEILVNEYFIDHPQQVLGRLDLSGKLYGARQVNVTPTGDLEDLLSATIEGLPQDIFKPVAASARRPTPQRVSAPVETKEGAYHSEGGKLYIRHNGELIEAAADHKTFLIISDILKIRDALRKLYRLQIEGEAQETIDAARAALNTAYDYFRFRHGFLHLPKNVKVFAQDPDSPTILALEEWDAQSKKATKTDVFFTNTIRGLKRAESAATIAEALGISLNESGNVETPRIASLLKVSLQDAERQLVSEKLAFKDPVQNWTLADLYLSGDVRTKLVAAREAARLDSQYQANVEALEAVQPEDVDYSEIDVKLGSPWIPTTDIADFLAFLLSGKREHFEVKFVERQGAWLVNYTNDGSFVHKYKPLANSVWGTIRADCIQIMQSALDDRPIIITDKIDSSTTAVNHEESAAANQKVKAMRQEFINWVWEDDERRSRLHRHYNDTFNNICPPKYSGAHLTFPGMNPGVNLRHTQKDGVWQVICCPNVLFQHEVGMGKTILAIAGAMELRRLGIAQKPAIVCLKANITQVVSEARRLYPTAKIISTTDKFDAKKRRQTVAKIASGDYDMVFLTHDNIDMLPMLPSTTAAFIKDEIREIEEAIWMAKEEDESKKNRAVKRLEKLKQRLEEQLKEAVADSRKDNAVYFEETGIDYLFVDEFDHYKSLPCHTKRDRIKGVPTTRSLRATNMWMRVRWLQQNHNGRGLVGLTGTSISNTLAELYINQRYYQFDELEQRGIHAFDSWANTFAEIITRMEYTVTGEFAPVSRFAKYVNLPELKLLSGQFMDVRFAEEVADIKRPKKDEQVITSPLSPEQKAYLSEIRIRAEKMRGYKPEKGQDNMLKVSTDARKCSLDMRLISSYSTDFPYSKTNLLIENVLAIYRDRSEVTQLIFSDMGVGETGYGFSLYQEIIRKLVAGGMPRDRIIDFSTLTDSGRDEAMERLRRGEASLGIGSTKKLGTGVNVQDRLAALHHLDVPWLPSWVTQRNGRGIRHGNLHYDWGIAVKIFCYVTEGSFDAFMWQTVSTKTLFVNQFLRAGVTQRTFKDEDTEELSPAKVMAIASGNPDLLLKVNLEEEVNELVSIKRRHERMQFRYKDEAARMRELIARLEMRVSSLQNDFAQAEQTSKQKFIASIGDQDFSERKEAATSIVKAVYRYYYGERVIGNYRGFEIVQNGSFLYIKGDDCYSINVNEEKPESVFQSIDGILRNLNRRIEDVQLELESYRSNVTKVEKEIGKTFKDEALLLEKQRELDDVMARLSAFNKEQAQAA